MSIKRCPDCGIDHNPEDYHAADGDRKSWNPGPQARVQTHVEMLRNLGERLDKQLERESRLLSRLKRLEERVDSVLGQDPKDVEVAPEAYPVRG